MLPVPWIVYHTPAAVLSKLLHVGAASHAAPRVLEFSIWPTTSGVASVQESLGTSQSTCSVKSPSSPAKPATRIKYVVPWVTCAVAHDALG